MSITHKVPPPMNSYKQLMATERGGSVFSREENPDTKSNLKWLALKPYKQQ